MGSKQWYLVSSHGSVLFYIATHPNTTIREIAEALQLTQRTVWSLIDDLRKKGMLYVRHRNGNGRRQHFTVNLDGEFLNPVIPEISLRQVLGELIRQYADRTDQN
jgi:DNA-binding MarR family transcriptional regulator